MVPQQPMGQAGFMPNGPPVNGMVHMNGAPGQVPNGMVPMNGNHMGPGMNMANQPSSPMLSNGFGGPQGVPNGGTAAARWSHRCAAVP